MSQFKNICKIAFVITMLVALHGCRKTEVDAGPKKLTGKMITFRGMNALLPHGYPENLINYTPDDYHKILNSKKGSSKTRNYDASSLEELDAISNQFIGAYPSFETKNEAEVAKAKLYFPGFTDQEIEENWDSILDYTEMLLGYDIAQELSENSGGANTSLFGVSWCEATYLLDNARMISGALTAKNKAEAQELRIAGTNGDGDGRGDAIRHSTLNVFLGKYACKSYGTVNRAAGKIKGLTDARENCSSEGPSKEMDLHNNAVGIDYYKAIADRTQVNCTCWIPNYNVIVWVSDDSIGDHMGNLPMILNSQTHFIRNTNLQTLIRIAGAPTGDPIPEDPAPGTVPFTLQTTVFSGSYKTLQFDGGPNGTVSFNLQNYPAGHTFYVPAGTYNHVYIETEGWQGEPTFFAFSTTGTGTQQCTQLSGAWIDLQNVTIDGSENKIWIGEYCIY